VYNSDDRGDAVTVHVKTRVLPGNRIEVAAEGLREGEDVEVTLESLAPAAQKSRRGILDLIDSLPPGPRSANTWEEVQRRLREERDSWDR
jgi:hypothetical protein